MPYIIQNPRKRKKLVRPCMSDVVTFDAELDGKLKKKREAAFQEFLGVDYSPADPIGGIMFGRDIPEYRLDPDHVVREAALKKGFSFDDIPHWDRLDHGYWMQSPRIKEILEGLGDRRRQYIEMKIYNQDRSDYRISYVVHFLHRDNCIDFERSQYERRTRRDGTSYWSLPIPKMYGGTEEAPLFVRAECIKGKHYWLDNEGQSSAHDFISDEFYEILMANDFVPEWIYLRPVEAI